MFIISTLVLPGFSLFFFCPLLLCHPSQCFKSRPERGLRSKWGSRMCIICSKSTNFLTKKQMQRLLDQLMISFGSAENKQTQNFSVFGREKMRIFPSAIKKKASTANKLTGGLQIENDDVADWRKVSKFFFLVFCCFRLCANQL